MTLERHRDAEHGERQAAALELAQQPPHAHARAVFVDRLHAEVPIRVGGRVEQLGRTARCRRRRAARSSRRLPRSSARTARRCVRCRASARAAGCGRSRSGLWGRQGSWGGRAWGRRRGRACAGRGAGCARRCAGARPSAGRRRGRRARANASTMATTSAKECSAECDDWYISAISEERVTRSASASASTWLPSICAMSTWKSASSRVRPETSVRCGGLLVAQVGAQLGELGVAQRSAAARRIITDFEHVRTSNTWRASSTLGSAMRRRAPFERHQLVAAELVERLAHQGAQRPEDVGDLCSGQRCRASGAARRWPVIDSTMRCVLVPASPSAHAPAFGARTTWGGGLLRIRRRWEFGSSKCIHPLATCKPRQQSKDPMGKPPPTCSTPPTAARPPAWAVRLYRLAATAGHRTKAPLNHDGRADEPLLQGRRFPAGATGWCSSVADLPPGAARRAALPRRSAADFGLATLASTTTCRRWPALGVLHLPRHPERGSGKSRIQWMRRSVYTDALVSPRSPPLP